MRPKGVKNKTEEEKTELAKIRAEEKAQKATAPYKPRGRTLAILEAITKDTKRGVHRTPAAIGEEVGTSASTVRILLRHLVDKGLAVKQESVWMSK